MDDRWGPFPGAYIRRYNQAHPAALEMLNNRGSAPENVAGGLERRSKWEEHGTAREWPFSGDDRGIQRIVGGFSFSFSSSSSPPSSSSSAAATHASRWIE